MKSHNSSSGAAVSLAQAMNQSTALAQLIEHAKRSNQCLNEARTLIPPGLHSSLTAGPLQDGVWCVLAGNNAAAAKVRQLLPALLAHLRGRGWEISSIRLKVQMPANSQ